MKQGVLYYSRTSTSGYGRAAVSYLEYLIDAGIQVRWEPIVEVSGRTVTWRSIPLEKRPDLQVYSPLEEQLVARIGAEIEYDVVLIHLEPELFAQFRQADKINIGFTAWETSKLPSHWPELIKGMDKLLVPSTFNEAVFSQAVETPVRAVPHIFEWSNHQLKHSKGDALRAGLKISPHTFLFYSINDWVPRKAWQQTLHTFLATFSADDDVCLLIKTSVVGIDITQPKLNRVQSTKRMVSAIVEQYANPAKVIILDRFMTEEGMQALHSAGQCYVSLSHGEGWGLNAFNAAHYASPIVVTGWGGSLDYLPEESTFLVNYCLEPVKEYVGWESYSRDQLWAVADPDHAKAQLRAVFENQAAANQRGLKLQQYVQQTFSRESVGQTLLDSLRP